MRGVKVSRCEIFGMWLPGARLGAMALVAAVVCSSALGCAKSTPGPRRPEVPVEGEERPVPPKQAQADVEYYEARAAAIASRAPDAVAKTDFGRLRRGRLYFTGGLEKEQIRALEDALTEAFKKRNDSTVLEVTAKILANDQADIRAHMLRAVVLRRSGRVETADYHRAVAISLIDSIVGSASGRGFASAWTVYRVKEELAVLNAEGCQMKSQSLVSKEGRQFDVIQAVRVESAEPVTFHFDVTELMAWRNHQIAGGEDGAEK
jgi:hypothetical protein